MELPAIILIDKPKGLSSFGVIRELRKRTGIKKFGHAGTLDPLATGLMILGVQKGTKLLTNLIKLDKEYIAEILIGESRTTGDMEGSVIDAVDDVEIDEKKVVKILQDLVGIVTLPVSAYSAIKKDGVPMYKRARKAAEVGEVISDVPIRDMKIIEAELLGITKTEIANKERYLLQVRFFVGSGTYIRSLGEEVGRRLGYPATLFSLRRTQIGEYKIADAQKIEDF